MSDKELRTRRGGRRKGAGRKPIYPRDSRVIQVVLSPEVMHRLAQERGRASLRAHASAVLTAAVLGTPPGK